MQAILSIGLAAGLAFPGCQQSDLNHPPDHLLGVWRTDAQPYADDSMEIRSDQVLFGTGNETARVYTIAAVREGVEKGRVLYSIVYHGPDLERQELTFYYQAADGGVITFKYQSQLRWTKKRRDA